MEPVPIPFKRAIAATETWKRHLLLGNGFSIGAHRGFGYPELYKAAIRRDPNFANLFREDGNTNFEAALRAAEDTGEAADIRSGLINAVAAVHPRDSLSITDEQRHCCQEFLEKFSARTRAHPGCVFTTNYDMLLHWVISRQDRTFGPRRQTVLQLHDGFDRYGIWHDGVTTQVFYLHGAVHIWQRPYNSLGKKVYTEMLRYGPNRPLTKQVAALLATGELPVFVAEGTALEKKQAQRRWTYLRKARRAFEGVCGEQDSVLFTFGHSFGESDDHITDCIAKGAIARVCIGVYSDEDRKRAAELANIWSSARSSASIETFKVYTFNSAECSVWNKAGVE